MDNQKRNIPSIATVGLNRDNVHSQLTQGQILYALNAVSEGFSGNQVTYQNDRGNEECLSFPEGYKVIGVKNITPINRVLYWLVNPTTGDSEIGYVDNQECKYNTLISDVDQGCKLKLSVNNPIHKAVTKITNCGTQVYWTDGLNPRRYIDFDDLPWKEIDDPQNDYKKIKREGELDCNKLNVQPTFRIPDVDIIEVSAGGSLVTGTYQFTMQYCDENGEGYTSYYNISNPVPIFGSPDTGDFNVPTNNSITIEVKDIDVSGLYEYFNIAVVKTINNITTVERVKVVPTSASTFKNGENSYRYTYTGSELTAISLNIEDVFLKFPYYDVAQDVTEVDNVIVWSNLQKPEEVSCQQIWNKVKTYWESYQIPYSNTEGYTNAINTAKYKGYMRDEVYAFEGALVLSNGRELPSCHIPGRVSTPSDLQIIEDTNEDNFLRDNDTCDQPAEVRRWQIYNTATNKGKTSDYTHREQGDDCYVGSYEYGDFAYWESEETYPNNSIIWGDLAGKPILHHKFPDNGISPIYNLNNETSEQKYKSFEHVIHPIGIKIDLDSLYAAINESDLPQEIKDTIVGFKIYRGNRATNKSVIAKGLMNNVGSSKYDQDNYLYPNYPYNDITPDNYYTYVKFERTGLNFITTDAFPSPSPAVFPGYPNNIGHHPQFRLNGFQDAKSERLVFHSPDTHFYQPSIQNAGSYMKLESIIYGKSYGHFVPVDNNAEYKFLTRKALEAATGIAVVSGMTIGGGDFGSPSFTLDSAPATYQAMNEIFEKIVPFINFGYSHTSIGMYGNYYNVPDDQGIKNRKIDFLKYTSDGAVKVEEGNTLNNFRRESSVYMHLTNGIDYTHNYSATIPHDFSRYTLGQYGDNLSPETIRIKDISSYYGAIKRILPSQWGSMFSYETIDTGYYHKLYDDNRNRVDSIPTVFGGDIFINRFAYKSKLSLFRRTTVGSPNQADIDYNDIGNLNYPMFWISTRPARFDIDVSGEVERVINEMTNSSVLNVLANVFSGGSKPAEKAQTLMIRLFKQIYQKLGFKDVNLDNGWDPTQGIAELGLMYLYVYGIPYYFCESEVNVDYRQAYNQKEGDFYPNVGGDIPDDWLQETNVPIINDNTYTYNRTYSKQNKESFIEHLPETFDPEEDCKEVIPNRAIWSDKSSQEELRNNWLIYRPSAYFDFPKSSGDLISLDKLHNIEVLARFENKTQKYNVLTTAQISEGPQAYLGNPALFSGTPPIDIADTDNGYAGSQNKFLLRTEFGHVFTDCKRGTVILLNSQGADTISNRGMSKWFAENLPFKILKHIPNYPTDNHLNGVGIHGTYDQLYQRLLITKVDYEPKEGVVAQGSEFIYDTGDFSQIVKVGDPEYFYDRSWTLSYSFKTNSWISFHSFAPNYYVAHGIFFQSGINSDLGTLWNHNTTYNKFNSYYGETESFIVEYPYNFAPNEDILQSVKVYSSSRVYEDFETFYEPDEIIFFNKVIVYNNQQCSGMRNLIPKPKNNLSTYSTYPKYNSDSIDILVSKSDSYYIFNGLWDVSVSKSEPIFTTAPVLTKDDKLLNDSNMSYTNQSFKKAPLRAKYSNVRLILDNRDDINLVTHFSIAQTTPSYR